MKRYIKSLSLRILFFLGLVFILFTIIDKIIYFNNIEEFEWIKEDKLINRMNSQKLQNSSWDKESIISKFIDDGPLPNKGDKKRILIVGDSVIWGHGYSNLNHLWWKQLQLMLYQNGYNDVEIVAAGASGYSTKQEFENILKNEDVMNEVDPDLIIVGYVENDPQMRDDNGKDLLPELYNGDLYYDSTNVFINIFKKLWPNLYYKMSQFITEKYMNEKWFQDKFGFQYNIWTRTLTTDPWKTMYESVLSDLTYFINSELDCPIFFIPTQSYPMYSQEILFIYNEFYKYGIKYYDPIPYYSMMHEYTPYSYEEWGINPVNGHPCVRVNQFYALYLYNLLIYNYPEIVGKQYNYAYQPLEINDWLPYKLKPIKIDDGYKITYPAKNERDSFLTLPIHKDYVKLNFRFPMSIKSIEITGDDIESIELFTNSVNENLGYDDQVMKNEGMKKDKFIWDLKDNNSMITSINISAKIKSNKSTDMYIKFNY